jgi:hypothetical protein
MNHVIYASIVLTCVFLARLYAPSSAAVLGAGIGLGLAYLYYRYEEKRNEKIMELSELGPVQEFMLRHQSYKQLSGKLYNELMRELVKFVEGYNRIVNHQVELYDQEYDKLVGQKAEVMNTFHSFVHVLDGDQDTMNEHTVSMKELKVVLDDMMNAALSANNGRTLVQGITTRSQFHHRNHPAGNDPEFDRKFSFFQRN